MKISQVVEGADINEVLHDLPLFKSYIYSLYNAQYADFFVSLGKRNLILIISGVNTFLRKLRSWKESYGFLKIQICQGTNGVHQISALLML